MLRKLKKRIRSTSDATKLRSGKKQDSLSTDPTRPHGPPLLPHTAITATLEGPDFSEFFRQHTCYDLVPTSSKIVVLDTTLSARKAFYALIHNSVRAGILWSSSQGRFTGLLTITDFIRVILDHWDKLSPDQQYANSVENTAGLAAIEEQSLEDWRATKNVGAEKSRPIQFTWISAQDSMLTALQTFHQLRIHRLPVIDPESGNVVSVLSHKRILKFFHMCLHSLFPSFAAAQSAAAASKGGSRSQSPLQPPDGRPNTAGTHPAASSLLSRKISELGVGTYGDDMLTATPDESVANVLRKMIDARVSAVPVIDRESGRIMSVYSRFDAIFLAADGSYAHLDIPLSQALSKRPNRTAGNSVLTCKSDEQLGVVVDRFVNEQVHRLIAVDDAGRPIGIVSLSDILRCLAALREPNRALLTVPSVDEQKLQKEPENQNQQLQQQKQLSPPLNE